MYKSIYTLPNISYKYISISPAYDELKFLLTNLHNNPLILENYLISSLQLIFFFKLLFSIYYQSKPKILYPVIISGSSLIKIIIKFNNNSFSV